MPWPPIMREDKWYVPPLVFLKWGCLSSAAGTTPGKIPIVGFCLGHLWAQTCLFIFYNSKDPFSFCVLQHTPPTPPVINFMGLSTERCRSIRDWAAAILWGWEAGVHGGGGGSLFRIHRDCCFELRALPRQWWDLNIWTPDSIQNFACAENRALFILRASVGGRFYLKGAKLYPFSNLCHLLCCSILANPAITAGKQCI